MQSLEIDKQTYILHSKLSRYKKQVLKAGNIIKEALPLADKWILSFSGGKDSIVLLDLLIKNGFKGEMMQFYYSEFETPEENQELAEYYENKYKTNLTILKSFSCKNAWDEIGYFYCIPRTVQEKELAKRAKFEHAKTSLDFCKENDFSGLFMGLRKEESKIRNMALSKYGDTYFAKCRNMHTSNPIAHFSDEDIWAYIFSNNLKYLSVYDCKTMDRRKIRNELNYMCARAAMFNGLFEGYKILYPDIVAKLKMRYGDFNI